MSMYTAKDLEAIANRLASDKRTARDIDDAKIALQFCARLIDAADRVVSEEKRILSAARQAATPASPTKGAQEGKAS